MTFSVIDLETTGLDATRDRVLEVAVIQLDKTAHIVNTWSSLVNPRGPIGATDIHGITAADVAAAPSFADILPELAQLLAGRAIVGHNISFDLSFLHAEFDRASYPHRIPREAGVCTMDQSRIYLAEGRHSLQACLDRASIDARVEHRALADAAASARLLATYMARESAGERVAETGVNRAGHHVRPAEWTRATAVAQRMEWPSVDCFSQSR